MAQSGAIPRILRGMERHLNERLGMAWRELEQLGVGQGILPSFIHFLGCVPKRHKDERERYYHFVLIRYYNILQLQVLFIIL